MNNSEISVNESILNSIKKLLNISKDDTSFDTDIIIHINSVITSLLQIGIGKENFRVVDKDTKWTDYISKDENIDYIKTYIYLKVKMIFDPPANGSIMQSFNETIKELEWRLHINYESTKDRGDQDG